ncbi:hypothetical protein E2C01_008762 [Portunus trituberculatus]|uniref:Uncharacterized protein n=1 Tax=Portunus trituberculatus TaxID=210409 RepID=A0A5B7D524_PORTR|nr:hypothetical protein [Portunus trituberculatus]
MQVGQSWSEIWSGDAAVPPHLGYEFLLPCTNSLPCSVGQQEGGGVLDGGGGAVGAERIAQGQVEQLGEEHHDMHHVPQRHTQGALAGALVVLGIREVHATDPVLPVTVLGGVVTVAGASALCPAGGAGPDTPPAAPGLVTNTHTSRHWCLPPASQHYIALGLHHEGIGADFVHLSITYTVLIKVKHTKEPHLRAHDVTLGCPGDVPHLQQLLRLLALHLLLPLRPLGAVQSGGEQEQVVMRQGKAEAQEGRQRLLPVVLVAAGCRVEDVAQLEDQRVGPELLVVIGQHLAHRDEPAEVDSPGRHQLGLLPLRPEP